jgi:hypothetical protein
LKFESVADLVKRMNEDASEARTLLAAAGDAFPPLAAARDVCADTARPNVAD